MKCSQEISRGWDKIVRGGRQPMRGSFSPIGNWFRRLALAGFAMTFASPLASADTTLESRLARAKVEAQASGSGRIILDRLPLQTQTDFLPANVIQWNPAIGIGSFHEPLNWIPDMVPGAGDTALFSMSECQVDVGSATTARLEIRTAGVLFTNADYTVVDTNSDPPAIVVDSAGLELGSGVLTGVIALVGENESTVLFDAILIVDSGAVLTLDTLRVGGAGNGILNINAGGSAMIRLCTIGNGVGEGTVMLSGLNAGLTGQILHVGFMGPGTLTLSDGASVTSDFGLVGEGSEASGATVQGAGSRWTVNDGLSIDAGTVTVQVDGVVDVQGGIGVGGDPSRAVSHQDLLIKAGGLCANAGLHGLEWLRECERPGHDQFATGRFRPVKYRGPS